MKILDPNVMVLASAGSGKTYQLGNRIIGFVAMGIDPESIVALTFTRKAAGEFTDSVLTKIAGACLDENVAATIRRDISQSGRELEVVDFVSILEKLIVALPQMTMGTMDGFFTRVVKAFPHELGVSSGTFQLLEGAELRIMIEGILDGILRRELGEEKALEFFQAFRKTLMGRESFQVRSRLEEYVGIWHRAWRDGADHLEWGPDRLAQGGSVDEWNRQREQYALKLQEAAEGISFNHGNQPKAWEKMCECLAQHSIGSGAIGKGGSLLERVIDGIAAGGNGELVIKMNKEFIIPEDTAALLRDTLLGAARAEMASACRSTRALREVIAMFDGVCEQRMRRKGFFNFDDIKVLMGAWSKGEDSRLLREALDYRLHSRFGHWLLDEFQDTSRADWDGLFPLIDEAATDDQGSLFIVGDKKQAIYGWRGGDVRLFDEVAERYSKNLVIETMSESYRSATEVLDLVNRVCGNLPVIGQFYGKAALRWQWDDHISAKPGLRGHARVECVEETEDADRMTRMTTILREIGVGEKPLSCGVLVRTNKEQNEVADHLRAAGFRVIEDGVRKPCEDNPIGVTVLQLMRWLADPADRFSEELLRMSPLWPQLSEAYGSMPWSAANRAALAQGFSVFVANLLEPSWQGMSAFGKNRCHDLLAALRIVDLSGTASAMAALNAMEKIEVGQSPGAAHVQVMTIHKAKGLGFDVVVLPLISTNKIPTAHNFNIARGEDWICSPPPSWARSLLPPLKNAEQEWGEQQQYESMCLLYVALTRAKRGLYVLLDAKETKEENNSLAHWIKACCDGESAVIFESGSLSCYDSVVALPPEKTRSDKVVLGAAVTRPIRKTASHSGAIDSLAVDFGSKIHALMEGIQWLDEPETAITGEHADYAMKALWSADIRKLLEKRGRNVELRNEFPVEGVVDGRWYRTVIDRLHIVRDEQQRVAGVEILDYKTDNTNDPKVLLEAHREQLSVYRSLIAKGLRIDESLIRCYLIGLKAAIVADF
jgi:superfamily I DNA/RNA helicase